MEKSLNLHFEVKKEERRYQFSAPYGAPFGETHDAIYEILKEILAMAKERSEQIEKKEEVHGE